CPPGKEYGPRMVGPGWSRPFAADERSRDRAQTGDEETDVPGTRAVRRQSGEGYLADGGASLVSPIEPRTTLRQAHQRLPHADDGTFPHIFAQWKNVGREHDDRRAVLEPAHLVAFPERSVAGDHIGARVFEAQHDVEKMQANTGDEHGRDRHQGHRVSAGGETRAQQRAFILAEQLLDPAQLHWIYMPGVARHVGHSIDAAIVRRVETVVHARGQPQRRIAAVAVRVDQIVVAQQILQRVGESLDLIEAGAGDAAAGADDRVAGTDQDV